MKSWYPANSTLLVTCATEARCVVADDSLERPFWLAASASASLLSKRAENVKKIYIYKKNDIRLNSMPGLRLILVKSKANFAKIFLQSNPALPRDLCLGI